MLRPVLGNATPGPRQCSSRNPEAPPTPRHLDGNNLQLSHKLWTFTFPPLSTDEVILTSQQCTSLFWLAISSNCIS